MKIAWIGNAGDGGGVGGFGRDLLKGLVGRHDMVVTQFTTEPPQAQRDLLGVAEGSSSLKIVQEPVRWSWNRWYSSNSASIFITSFLSRAAAHRRLIMRLLEVHRKESFDCVVQFSQFELLSMRRHLKQLPPVVLIPCVHAAGELYWHAKERRIALQSERRWMHWMVRANLKYRARCQARDIKRVAGQVGMSRRFNELVRRDYNIPALRQAVVYQPVDERIAKDSLPTRATEPTGSSKAKIKILYVGRISVRKGIDMLVTLSHRIKDLKEESQLRVIGGPSFWSNYTGEVKRLNADIARYDGALGHQQILEAMREADILLVPSKYEPGGIVVAEAMAQGCFIVASDEVGSAEMLPDGCCAHFSAGDDDAFEAAVRLAISKVRMNDHRREAIAVEAFRLFSPARQIDALAEFLYEIVSQKLD